MPRPGPAALTVSRSVLRSLIVLNAAYGTIVLAIQIGMFVAGRWTMTALGVPPSADTLPLIRGMQMIAGLGLVGVPLNFIVISRLLAIVETVLAGDPFVAQNAARLQAISWALLGLQLLQLVIGTIASSVGTPAHPLHISAFSVGGWLAVVLLFVLARVFGEGTRMRDDLRGTV
jgi:hypothetical protein